MGLRLGLLSTANINGSLVRGAAATDAVDVVAIGSRDGERARAAAEQLGVARTHDSYEAVLADPEVDAVYIPLPNSLHVEWSVRALEAGKHVLCEKPMSRHPEEVERAFDAAESAGRVLAEAFMWRHHPQAKRLVELLPRLGELRLIRAHFSFPLPAAPNIRLSQELEGGALMDVGCYCVSAARLLAGEPEEVSARQVTRDGVDIRLSAVMSFAGDVLAHFDCGMDLAPRAELEVVGSEATARLPDPWHSRAPVIEIAGERIEIEPVDPYTAQLADFAAACSGEREHPFGRDDAVGQACAIAALYESAAQ